MIKSAKVLSHLHFNNIELVDAQCKIDPDFSSVKSANPEEHEAFDLAIKQAQYSKADLIIATDDGLNHDWLFRKRPIID
jgi:phosphoglucomutase